MPVDPAAPYTGEVFQESFHFSSEALARLKSDGLQIGDEHLLPGIIDITYRTENVVIPSALATFDAELATEILSVWDLFASHSQKATVLGPRFSKDASWTTIVAHYYHALDRLEKKRHVSSDSPFVREALFYWNSLVSKIGK